MAIPSGYLPFEDREPEWLAALEPAFLNAREPFDALRDWVSSPLKGNGVKSMDDATIYGIGALVTKLLKVYRGMLILCERGHGSEALVLVRVVLETDGQIVWVCRSDDPRVALLKVLAHEQLRLAVLFNDNAQSNDAVEARLLANQYGKRIVQFGGRYDPGSLEKNWHGMRGGFEQLCKTLDFLVGRELVVECVHPPSPRRTTARCCSPVARLRSNRADRRRQGWIGEQWLTR
jgi:hypothetical protein